MEHGIGEYVRLRDDLKVGESYGKLKWTSGKNRYYLGQKVEIVGFGPRKSYYIVELKSSSNIFPVNVTDEMISKYYTDSKGKEILGIEEDLAIDLVADFLKFLDDSGYILIKKSDYEKTIKQNKAKGND